MAALVSVMFVLVVAIALVARRSPGLRTVVVLAYQRGVRFRRGAMDGVVGPGVYRTWGRRTIQIVDMRLQTLQVPGQELLTTDGITLKLTMAGEYRVVDPERYVTASVSSAASLYQRGQQALRTAVEGQGFEALLASRSAMGERVRGLLAEQTRDLGVEVVSMEVRDVLLSGELRRSFAQAATARQDAAAALERARGETASLRSLLNAARLMEDVPSLLQLRAIQATEGSRGSTLVLGVGAEVGLRGKAGRSGGREDGADGE